MSPIGAGAAALAVLLAGLIAPPARAAPRVLPVLISTDLAAGLGEDPGSPFPSDVDDAIATALALNTRGLEVEGIAVSFGNNRVEASTRQARTLVHRVMRRRVAVEPGAARRLPPVRRRALGRRDPCVNAGVRLLAARLGRRRAAVLVLGPMTDLACLSRAYPRAAGRILRVVAEAGRAPRQPFVLNGRPGLWDLNFSADPAAQREVLARLDVPVTFVPWSVNSASVLDDARLDRLGGRSPEGRWLRRQAGRFRSFWRSVFGDDGLRPWDQNVVYSLIEPRAYVSRSVGWRIVSCRERGSRRPTSRRCAGHGPEQLETLAAEPAQLWLGRGPGQRRKRGLRALVRLASPAAQRRFLDTVARLRARVSRRGSRAAPR